MARRVIGFLVLLALVILGCGGSSPTPSTTPYRGIRVEPSTTTIKPGENHQFTAVVDGGDQAVRWSVIDVGGGSINAEGRYTAPNRSGSFTIRAEVASDSSKNASATIVVDSGWSVNIPTLPLRVGIGGSIDLDASVTGPVNQAVTWTTTAGTISDDGVLSNIVAAGPILVTATSVADPGKSKTVTVQAVPFVEFTSPTTLPPVIPKSTIDFKVNVVGAASNAVTWSATAGTISATGVFTAPDATGTVTVTATSTADPSKSASVTFQVIANANVVFEFESRGTVTLALRPDKAPRHCANLVSLANKGFYDGIIVHRYEPGFVVQWGDPLTKTLPLNDSSIGTGGPGYSIDFEPNDLLHLKYALGMARASGLNTAGSQIYICLNDLPSLDTNYVVFGSVVSGTSVIDALRAGDRITRAYVVAP